MKVEVLLLPPSEFVPNHPDLPVLIYTDGDQARNSQFFKSTFAKNGWSGIWVNGVFDYHHYHTTAHEVLGVGKGEADLQIGGPMGPILSVKQAQCLLLPAGTGHKLIKRSDHFQVVGAYPTNSGVDIQRAAPSAEMMARIKNLPLPKSDPLLGAAGGLLKHWAHATSQK
jgi:uncharacterized protein YjlB